jgi:hypothetical protein
MKPLSSATVVRQKGAGVLRFLSDLQWGPDLILRRFSNSAVYTQRESEEAVDVLSGWKAHFKVCETFTVEASAVVAASRFVVNLC